MSNAAASPQERTVLRRKVIRVMIPIFIQNGITNFVSMLDNIMVGRLGDAEINGVSVAGQLMFVFTLCVFGAVSGAGIFGAQFAGSGDDKGVRDTFRFKLLFCTAITVGAIALFAFRGGALIDLFLRGEGDRQLAADSLARGVEYLNVMLIGLVPFTLAQCWSSTLRETGKTTLPMAAGIAAVGVNLALNYVLIFGNLGAPRLGVVGAAVATVVSRFVELGIIVVATAVKRKENPFIIGAFKSLRVPRGLVGGIFSKGLPLMINEALWAAGIAMLSRCYSTRGLDVVTANTINNTFWNVFSVAFLSVGVAIGIILGQMLGAGDIEGAKRSAKRLMVFSVLISVVVGAAYAAISPFVPGIYNTDAPVRELATKLMLVCAVAMPLEAYANAAYFTLRSGGEALITMIFDSGFVWAVCIPAALVISEFTSMPIIPFYAVIQFLNIVKCLVGYIFFRRGKWAKKIVSDR